MSNSKQSEITLKIELDEDNMPENIIWSATDHPDGDKKLSSKALFLSLFDAEHRDTLRFDLWTKEMQVQEMDRMVYYTLKGLADTYFRATSNKELAEEMQKFALHFAQRTEIIPKQ
jgi:gliding motility-associated protein GldC